MHAWVKRAWSSSRNHCLTETPGLVSGMNDGNPGSCDTGFLPHSDAGSMKKGHAQVCFTKSTVKASQ